ncbi:putative ubiquitin carboxyl-terminal hydrolase 3 [Fusarium oxysporum f. sp. albedinis]|nr:putative ubiquitin carboxyl-terminal hydrolase 3 [Fusarium oxysporum f. sp. albedinis]
MIIKTSDILKKYHIAMEKKETRKGISTSVLPPRVLHLLYGAVSSWYLLTRENPHMGRFEGRDDHHS